MAWSCHDGIDWPLSASCPAVPQKRAAYGQAHGVRSEKRDMQKVARRKLHSAPAGRWCRAGVEDESCDDDVDVDSAAAGSDQAGPGSDEDNSDGDNGFSCRYAEALHHAVPFRVMHATTLLSCGLMPALEWHWQLLLHGSTCSVPCSNRWRVEVSWGNGRKLGQQNAVWHILLVRYL